MQLQTITTKLETADRDAISAILDWKAGEVGANATADYIARAIDNIDSGVSRIDNAIKELQAIKKDMKQQQEVIKVGVAAWLTDNGIEKLQGDLISSVSVSEKKESVELIIDDEEACINAGFFKMTLDKTALKNAILDGAEIEGSRLEITYSEDSLRINKRKAKAQS